VARARPLLAVRADGGPGIGVGHLVRSLALVQAWIRARGDAVLVSHEPPAHWAEQYQAAGCPIVSPSDRPRCDWWAVDGYHLSAADRAGRGARVLVIDDADTAGTGGAGADLLLDQNLAAPTYPHATEVRRGPRYALLREEVTAAAAGPRTVDDARLLVAVGGAPAAEVSRFAVQVGAGATEEGWEVSTLGGTDDAPASMARAGLAVAAAGSTSWELCCFGIPSVLVAVAPNQEAVADNLAEAGAAIRAPLDAGAVLMIVRQLAADRPRRAAMSKAGASLVDGRGAARITTRLRSALLSLRPAADDDIELIHRWNDDERTRAASFATGSISWDDHVRWFAAQQADPGAWLLIGSDALGAVGLVRFQVLDGTAEIGLTVAPERRGEGHAAALIDAGCSRIADEAGVTSVLARVKPANTASIRAFLAADFDEWPDQPDAAGARRYVRVVSTGDDHG
jgi:UDP-2,4-diacetamido-2,4,6-trideoxy-beta-L-altropyranose hydrolase